jgi:hypothetical protein
MHPEMLSASDILRKRLAFFDTDTGINVNQALTGK